MSNRGKRAMRRRADCTGKRVYPGWTAAAKAAKRMSTAKDDRFKPYRCRFCSAWHVGAGDRLFRLAARSTAS